MKYVKILLFLLLLMVVCASSQAQTRLFGNAAQSWPQLFEDAWGAATGDVDGDGDLDVLLAQDGLNRLLLHRAGGVFVESEVGLPSEDERTVDVALFDVDEDGDLDFVAANFESQNRLYLNAGDGTFVDASSGLPVDANRSVDLSTGDVDGDGDVDVLVGNSSSQQNRLYLNEGGGLFTDATTQLPVDADRTVELVFADLDLDGDLDALAANDLQNRKYENTGIGVFVDASSDLPRDTDESYGIDVGDLDGDGDPDIVIGNLQNENRLYRNDGNGVFTKVLNALPPGSLSTYVVHFFDLDGDLDLDILFGNNGWAVLCENDGAAEFEDVSDRLPVVSLHTRALLTGDWDADGDPDLVFATVSEDPDAYLRNEGGVFVEWTNGDDLGRQHIILALADVDGDGDPDAIVDSAPYAAVETELFRNDGSGRFVLDPLALPEEDFFAPAFGDVDGDGALDLFFGQDDARQARLFLGDGLGGFVDATGQLPVNDDFFDPVVLGDLDGDGDLDAYLGNSPGFGTPGFDHLYLNDGDGVFVDAAGVPQQSFANIATKLVDLDADGDLDVLLVCGQSGKRMWRNEGGGSFSDASSGLPDSTTNNSITLAVGDVDADGDADAFFGNFGFAELYLNDGSGVFEDASSTHLTSILLATRSALRDLDEDGDPDLLLQHLSPSGPLGLFVHANDGTGVFGLRDDAIEPSETAFSELLEDLDGDGDWDAPLTGRILFGWRRQVTAVGAAVRGRDVLFDLRGPAGEPWLLAYSTGTTRVDVGAFGTLLIDPLGLAELGAGILDAEGAAELPVPVPDDPVLAGRLVFVQGAVGAPFRLTNLEVVTIL